MTITTTPAQLPVRPISRAEAHARAREAYRLFAADVAALAPADWGRPTDCEGWSVRDLVGHMVGAQRAAASVRELLRQQRAVRRRARATGDNETDVMTALQIELTADLSPAAAAAELAATADAAARGRSRIPGPARRLVKIPVEFGEVTETWTLGYLVDVILTRDAWLHRIDLARAVGTEPALTLAHDGRIVADVVAEWAARHGRPFRLTLTGPAGGSWAEGDPDEDAVLELDGVDFCRAVSGRGERSGLLAVDVPF